jgi:hypothetical protein
MASSTPTINELFAGDRRSFVDLQIVLSPPRP